MSKRKWEYPKSILATFDEYFQQFEHTEIVVIDPQWFYACIDLDELTEKWGPERVERDYTALCSMEWVLQATLKIDQVKS